MKEKNNIRYLFMDIVSVLLTDGWTTEYCALAASKFNLDFTEIENRHQLTFDTYEEVKLPLNEYLNCVVFYMRRSFLCIADP